MENASTVSCVCIALPTVESSLPLTTNCRIQYRNAALDSALQTTSCRTISTFSDRPSLASLFFEFSVTYHWRLYKKIQKSFPISLDKAGELWYNIIRQRENISYECGSGGTGRRARLRGVWYTPYGFKSRFPHKADSEMGLLFLFLWRFRKKSYLI